MVGEIKELLGTGAAHHIPSTPILCHYLLNAL